MADKNKISFDFDGTISTSKGQEMAKKFIDEDFTVYIVTARNASESEAVYAVADKIGIPHSRIYFTGGKDKWPTIKRLNIGIHYDNNPEQVKLINQNTESEGRLFKA